MIVKMFLSFHCIDIQLALDSRFCKYFCTIMVIKSVIGDMFNNSCCFLLIDKLSRFEDQFFGIILVLLKNRRLNACHDANNARCETGVRMGKSPPAEFEEWLYGSFKKKEWYLNRDNTFEIHQTGECFELKKMI